MAAGDLAAHRSQPSKVLSSGAGQMAKPLSQSLLCIIAAAALAARGGEAAPIVIEDFSGPVDAFFLDDGSAAGLPSSGNSALEKVDDGLRLNYDVARNGPFGAALMGKIWGGYRDLSNASHIRLTYRVERRRINSTASDDGVELPRRARCVGLPRRRGDGVEPPRPRGARRRAFGRQGVRPRAPPPPRPPPLAAATGAKLAAVATRPVNARRAAVLRTAAAASGGGWSLRRDGGVASVRRPEVLSVLRPGGAWSAPLRPRVIKTNTEIISMLKPLKQWF